MGFLPSNQPFNNSDVHFSTLPDLGHDFIWFDDFDQKHCRCGDKKNWGTVG